MHTLNTLKVGLSCGGFLALWHAFWSLLVAMGFAQPLLDFIFHLHMINNPYIVTPFNPMTALLLIIVTGIIGTVMGYVFASVWNMLHRS